MKQIIFLFFYVLCISVHKLEAQGMLKDADGESSILLPTKENNGIDLKFSSATTKFSLAFSRNKTAIRDLRNRDTAHINSYKKLLLAGSVDISAKEGIGELFKGKKATGEIGASFSVGYKNMHVRQIGKYTPGHPAVISGAKITHNLYGTIDASYSKLKVLDLSTDTLNFIINEPNLFNAQFLVHYNCDLRTRDDKALIFFGISVGYAYKNNSDDLDDIQIDTILAVRQGKSAISSKTYKNGPLNKYHTIPLNIDIGISPSIKETNILGFNAYFRSELLPKPTMNAGLGIYFSKRDAPSEVVGGLAYQFNDLTNDGDSKEKIFKRNTLFFYIGYTIPFN